MSASPPDDGVMGVLLPRFDNGAAALREPRISQLPRLGTNPRIERNRCLWLNPPVKAMRMR